MSVVWIQFVTISDQFGSCVVKLRLLSFTESARCDVLPQPESHVAAPQGGMFAAKNQHCIAQPCATWASIKMRLDYGDTQNS